MSDTRRLAQQIKLFLSKMPSRGRATEYFLIAGRDLLERSQPFLDKEGTAYAQSRFFLNGHASRYSELRSALEMVRYELRKGSGGGSGPLLQLCEGEPSEELRLPPTWKAEVPQSYR